MEIEAKYRLTPGQREKLQTMLGEGEHLFQEDRYYEIPDKVLRIRRENGQFLLTQKGEARYSSEGVKSRSEEEGPLSPEEVALLERLLPWIGHPETIRVRKERRVFPHDGVLLCLDRVEELGDFLEIEAKPGEGVGAVQRASAWLEQTIGLSPEQVERSSYAKLLADKQAKPLGKSLES